MTWEGVASISALVGLIITIITNATILTWFLAKLVARVESWTEMFSRFEKGLEKYMVNTDIQIQSLWKRHDELKEKVITLEAKQGG